MANADPGCSFIQPDLSLWQGSRRVFVGDVKYKRILPTEYPMPTSTRRWHMRWRPALALLIYAGSEGEPARHRIVRIGKQIEVVVVDLSVPPARLLEQIDAIPDRIRGQIADVRAAA